MTQKAISSVPSALLRQTIHELSFENLHTIYVVDCVSDRNPQALQTAKKCTSPSGIVHFLCRYAEHCGIPIQITQLQQYQYTNLKMTQKALYCII